MIGKKNKKINYLIPLILAMTGLESLSLEIPIGAISSIFSESTLLKAFKSAPAQNTPPSPCKIATFAYFFFFFQLINESMN